MKRDEFRRVFDNIEYTKEFTESMEEKLSTSPSAQLEDGYTEAVSGVEISRRSRIVRIAGTAAACLALVGSCVGIGFAMKGSFKPDDDVLSSVNDNTSANASTETATVPTLDMLIDSRLPYTDLSGKTEDELLSIGNDYYNAACELYLLKIGSSISLECDYNISATGKNGTTYYLVKDERFNSISDINDFLHTVFRDYETASLAQFHEEDGKLYYSMLSTPIDYTNYEGWDINFVEATDEKITYQINAYFNDGEAGKNVQSFPAKFTLVPENGKWKVDEFFYPTDIPLYGDIEHEFSNDSAEELKTKLRTMLTEAELYSYSICSPYFEDTHADEVVGSVDPLELGWAIMDPDSFDFYWLITNGKTKQEMLDEIYSYFTEDYETNFDELVIERDGNVYAKIQPLDFDPFHDYTASNDAMEITTRNNKETVVQVYVDCTEAIDYFYANNIGMSVLPEDYKYTYIQKVVLVNTEDGWRISEYTPYAELRNEAIMACPEMQPYIDDNGMINAPDVNEPIDYSSYIGIWTSDNGDTLTVHDMNDETIEFTIEYSGIGSVTASAVMGNEEYGQMTYFNTMDDDSQIGIEGNIYYSEGCLSVYLHRTENENIPESVSFYKKDEKSQSAANGGINPADYIGTWRVDGDAYGYELNVISADDTEIVFEYSSYRSFGTSPITAEIYCGGSAYFNTLGADDNINIEGNLNLNSDGTISLEITSSESSMVTVGTCITFNTKVQ